MTPADVTGLERLMQPASPERAALNELVPGTGESRASVLHALVSVGMDAVRERARETAYAVLAAQPSDDDELEIRTARRRQLAGWRDEAP